MDEHWIKVIPERASDVINANDLDAGSQDLLKPGMRPEAFIRELAAARKWSDAVKVMTRALPPREAVWWACVCARHIESLASDSNEIAALEAAEKWVYKPTEENRRDAFRLAQKSKADSAGTLSALAAAFSAGNLPAAEDQHIDLENGVFSRIVDAVVMISAAEKQGKRITKQFQCFLRCGEDIACGGNGQIEDRKG
jgi:hypothetical protein